MRTLVLCIDGLDHRLAREFRMRSLLQEYNGVIDLSEFQQRYGRVHSLEIWHTFLTGEMPPEKLSWVTPTRLLDYSKRVADLLGVRRAARRVALALGLSRILTREYKVPKALPDLVDGSRTIGMVLYDDVRGSMGRLAKAIKKGVQEYEREAYLQFYGKRRAILALLAEDFKLALAYIRLLDSIGHVYPRSKLKLMKAYSKVNSLVSAVRARFSGAVMVVSDHGMDHTGMHYPEAFWSLNTKPPFHPRRVADLHELVLKLVEA